MFQCGCNPWRRRRKRTLHAGGYLSSPLPLPNPLLPLLISQGLSPCCSWDFWEILEKWGRHLPMFCHSLSASLYHCLALSSWLIWQLLLLFIELISGYYRLLQVIKAHLDEQGASYRKVVGSVSSDWLLFLIIYSSFTKTAGVLLLGRLDSVTYVHELKFPCVKRNVIDSSWFEAFIRTKEEDLASNKDTKCFCWLARCSRWKL